MAFPLLWPPRKKRTAEAEEALDQGLAIPTHLPQIPHLLQLQREKNKNNNNTTLHYCGHQGKSGQGNGGAGPGSYHTNTVAASTDGKIEKSQVQIKICPDSSLCFQKQKLIGESDFHIILINQVCHLLHAQHLLIGHHAVSSSHVFRRQGGVIVAPRRGGLLCPQ